MQQNGNIKCPPKTKIKLETKIKMIREYFQTKLTSPEKILSWTERLLPNGNLVGEITKSV